MTTHEAMTNPGMSEVTSKREFALSLLSECASAFVHLDPRRPGVLVPLQFQKQPQLVLQVGYGMPVPIPDLQVEEDGIACTLSFNRRPHYCFIPWGAVYALIGENRRALVWPQDVPAEVVAQQSSRAQPSKGRSHLKAVPRSDEAKAASVADDPPTERAAVPSGSGAPPAPEPEPSDEAGEASAARPDKPKAAPAARAPSQAPSAAERRSSETGASSGRPKRPPYLRLVK